MRFKKTRMLAMMGLLCLLACAGGTGEGNPEFGVLSVSLSARVNQPVIKVSAGLESRTPAKAEANDTLLLFDAGNTPYLINHIYAHFDQVEIERPKGGSCRSSDTVICTDSTIIVSGPQNIDLLMNPSPLILNNLTMPLGVYNWMKVRFTKLAVGDSGIVPTEYLPLVGHSLRMKGTFAYRGVPNRDMTIYIDIDEAFAFENAAGLAVRTDLPYGWAGVFLANRWLKNLDITKCLDENQIALGPDGSLVIDGGTACNGLKDSLLVNVRNSTSFEIEDDEDEIED